MTREAADRLLARVWSELGRDDGELALLAPLPDAPLPARLDVSALAVASVAAASLAGWAHAATPGSIRLDGDRIAEGRLAFGGVALKPWRSPEAEAALRGQPASADTFRRAAEAAMAGAKPSGDNGYKIELARRIAVRALTLAFAGTPERVPALPASPFSSPLGVAADV